MGDEAGYKASVMAQLKLFLFGMNPFILSGSCALVQDNGLSAAFTIAHEIGHV